MKDDTISRQAAIDAAINAADEWDGGSIPSRQDMIEKAINKLPSAERRGRWERKKDPYGFFDTIPVCSVCGCTTKYRETSLCCPTCGAKMDLEEVWE